MSEDGSKDRMRIHGGFYDNLTSKAMNAATTVKEIRAAMSPSSKLNEAAFWKYVSERHDRTVRAGKREVTSVEKIAKEMYEKDPFFFVEDDINESKNDPKVTPKVMSSKRFNMTMDKDIALAVLMKQVEELGERLDSAHQRLSEQTVGLDKEGGGLIYFVMDKDFMGRAKIGRTQEFDLRKLRTRYGTTLNPVVFAFLSDCVVRDETALLKLMHDHDLMWDGYGTEQIKNTEKSRSIFTNYFAEKSL
ncbi:protein of unknown function (DUF1390) [Paramecium bursaria Chlorella virus NE-JV-1]|nr:protein of unknown function (DUF1390) [Paramecium bursaria Chlorella virus NE-JV-1]